MDINIQNLDKYFCILEHDTIIRETSGKCILIRPCLDYSKRNLLEITEFSKNVLNYLHDSHSLREIKSAFQFSDEEFDEFYKFLKYLNENSYVRMWSIIDNENTPYLSSILRESWYKEGVPFGCTMELSSRCNFQCVHCYLGKHRMDREQLSTDQIKSIFNKLKEIGIIYIFLSGGEPLFRQDFEELYIYAKKQGFLISLLTNGYLINDYLIQLFREYPPIELDISLYGASDSTYEAVTGVKGAFSRIKENILKLKQYGIFVSAKSPVMQLTKNDVQLMQKFADEYKIPFRMFFEIHQSIDGESLDECQIEVNEAAKMYSEYAISYPYDKRVHLAFKCDAKPIKRKRYACGAGRNSCFVDYRGIISPCIHTRHRGEDIFSKPINQIWHQIQSISYECLVDNEDYKCLHCDKIMICKSCPARRENYYGSPLIVTERDCAFAEALQKIIEGGD